MNITKKMFAALLVVFSLNHSPVNAINFSFFNRVLSIFYLSNTNEPKMKRVSSSGFVKVKRCDNTLLKNSGFEKDLSWVNVNVEEERYDYRKIGFSLLKRGIDFGLKSAVFMYLS